MNRTIIFISFVIILLGITTAQAAKVINIGIITDGPIEQAGWSPTLFKEELLLLTKGDFDIRFPESKELDGGWEVEQIKAVFQQLQYDPEVDMVLTLGYISSSVACLSQSLRKPTFAPFVMDADLLGLPRKGNSSGVTNLNYLTGEADFVRDLKTFLSVATFDNVVVLVDQSQFEAQPVLIERAREVAAAGGVGVSFILNSSPNEDLAAKLPEDTEAVVVTTMPRLNTIAMQRLIAALIEKRIPSYSLIGSHLVEQGILMSEVPASDWQRLARRNALNMRAILHGESAADQPVTFERKRRLTINIATARAINVYPQFDVLNKAVLLNEEPEPHGRKLSLSMVAMEAAKVNLDLRAAALGLQANETAIARVRASLRPQLQAEVSYTRLKDDGIAVSSGAAAEQSTTATVTLSQLLYSDQVRANVEIQRYLQENQEALYRQLELDIIQEATQAYLNVLKAQTFVKIRQENMQLTRTNLELARVRQRIGVANPSETYRWESELATARKELLNAQAQLQQSRDVLNRLLNRPLKESFIATPATLEDPTLIVSRKELFDYVVNQRAFELMGEFMINEGLKASPELVSLETLVAATEREIKTNQRAYWSPTVALQSKFSNVLDEDSSGGLSAEGDTDWSIGINVSLPLFEGGARRARLAGSRLALEQIRVQQAASRQRIIQRIRFNLHRIAASYPAIELSNDAATAANKNLELITDAYSRGVSSILDLLDAQNAALVAEESATNAVFDFLIDLMNLQRSLGRFDFFLGAQGLDNWLEQLKTYISSGK
jgi:outer membrane protein TolC